MAANTQFSIAVHLLAALGFCGEKTGTSARLAMSVNTSPSFVRRTLAKLSKAGLVETTTGKSGSCRLAREPGNISLLDIYHAVDAPKAFAIHDYAPQEPCKVSCNIKSALELALRKPQAALEESLGGISLADVLNQLQS